MGHADGNTVDVDYEFVRDTHTVRGKERETLGFHVRIDIECEFVCAYEAHT